MSDTPPRTASAPPPSARARPTRWPGLVWALPLAALLVVLYLGLRALSDQGVDVVVIFPSAAGAKVGDTKVIYQGLEAGRVVKMALDPDGRRVDMTLRLDARARPALNTDTKFWLIGAKPSLTDIDSVKAVLAGVTIGMSPGQGGRPTRRFTGLGSPPVVDPTTKGTRYTLRAHILGPVRPGSAVLYHGQEIGKVVSADLADVNSFQLGVFVYKPYDSLIRAGGQFWTSSPLQVSLAGSSISTVLAPADTVLSGGVDFDLPESARAEPQAPAGSTFILYRSQADAQAGLNGPNMLYTVVVKGPAGDVAPGAPVRLMGYQVGDVRENHLMFDARTGLPYTELTAAIYPRKLGLNDPTPGVRDADAWRAPTDAKLNQLLARGYRVRLTQTPPLIGPHGLSLDPTKLGPARLGGGAYPTIPSDVSGGDVADLTAQADQILQKVNRIPIEAIGADVRQITGRLRSLVGSPKLSDSLDHLDSTLGQVDQMVAEVKPQVGPLVAKLNQAADQLNGTAAAAKGVLSGEGAAQDASLPGAIQQLTEAARSIRSLTDYLGRHPEALIKGKVKDSR